VSRKSARNRLVARPVELAVVEVQVPQIELHVPGAVVLRVFRVNLLRLLEVRQRIVSELDNIQLDHLHDCRELRIAESDGQLLGASLSSGR
jgi:hypothetical protein